MTEYVKIPKDEYTDLIELIEKDAQIIKEFYFEIQKLQQEKQDLKEWLEEEMNKEENYMCDDFDAGIIYAFKEVLERLG